MSEPTIKRGRGRPRTHGSDVNAGLKLGLTLYAATKRAAEIDGVSWSEWMRDAAEERLKKARYRPQELAKKSCRKH